MPYLAPFTHTSTDIVVPPALALPARSKPSDHTLYREGDRAQVLYIVRSGLLKGTFMSPRLQECVHALYGPGDIIGTAALETTTHDENVVTCSRAELVPVLPKNLTHYGKFCAYVFGNLCEQRRRQAYHIADREYGSDARVARVMLRLAQRFGQESKAARVLSIPLSQEELAGYCGLTRVTVNRSLGRLEKAGCVVGGRGRWTVNLNSLHRLIGIDLNYGGGDLKAADINRATAPTRAPSNR